jgi:hypothetical protein
MANSTSEQRASLLSTLAIAVGIPLVLGFVDLLGAFLPTQSTNILGLLPSLVASCAAAAVAVRSEHVSNFSRLLHGVWVGCLWGFGASLVSCALLGFTFDSGFFSYAIRGLALHGITFAFVGAGIGVARS